MQFNNFMFKIGLKIQDLPASSSPCNELSTGVRSESMQSFWHRIKAENRRAKKRKLTLREIKRPPTTLKSCNLKDSHS